MENKKKFKFSYLRLLFHFLIAMFFLGMCLIAHNPFTADNLKDKMRFWSDIFVIPAVIEYGLVALSFSSHQGVFDGLTYSLKYAFAKFIPMPHIDEEISGGYADYKDIRASKRRDIPLEAIIIASIFMIVGLVFMIIYYNI